MSGWLQLVSIVVVVQIASTYYAAYRDAPRDLATFVDTVDCSVGENESYDRDVAKVQRLDDKIRLGRLLREIQKSGDDLREDLNDMLLSDTGTTLKTTARLLWASNRARLEDRIRRLDLLRMRFLVLYMGSLTSVAADREKQIQPPPPPPLPLPHRDRDPEKNASASSFDTPTKPQLAKSLTDSAVPRPPLRRLTTNAIGHQETITRPHRRGWAGVVEELQTSPRMQQRHASIEEAMARTPPSI
ncbi:hypothetical protein B0I35DRAFT_474922 [Stachybotrys elegans]|uniref:Uncharacterized protein n=1 Tax=Stachybotrys elegans TaxID=80388 RepID=A0A8K0T371_9HYPO|nr:hypothetical protein B0I35DRAFT_474922 [Stachybotrys elegans]